MEGGLLISTSVNMLDGLAGVALVGYIFGTVDRHPVWRVSAEK
jgi:hypothetical protein